MHKRHKLYVKAFFLSLSIFTTINLSADSLVYKYNTKDKEVISKMDIMETETGYIVKTTRGQDEFTVNTDKSYATLKWQQINSKENTDITAERQGEKLIISGKLKSEDIKKTIKIDGLPWIQEWNAGFKPFITSNENIMKFWALEPVSFKRVAEFQLEKKKNEEVTVNGKKTDSVYTWISPASKMIRVFWKGQGMWYRKTDGLNVYQKDENGILQLIEEK